MYVDNCNKKKQQIIENHINLEQHKINAQIQEELRKKYDINIVVGHCMMIKPTIYQYKHLLGDTDHHLLANTRKTYEIFFFFAVKCTVFHAHSKKKVS